MNIKKQVKQTPSLSKRISLIAVIIILLSNLFITTGCDEWLVALGWDDEVTGRIYNSFDGTIYVEETGKERPVLLFTISKSGETYTVTLADGKFHEMTLEKGVYSIKTENDPTWVSLDTTNREPKIWEVKSITIAADGWWFRYGDDDGTFPESLDETKKEAALK